MEKVIGSILRAKGYTVFEHDSGADGGVDLLACNGPLGFEPPKICVQVKTENSPIGRPALDQLKGVMTDVGADYGLFVSWGGFTTNVINDKRKTFFKIRLWDHKDVVCEFLNNYDKLDDDIKKKVPLQKIWVLTEGNERTLIII